MSFGWRVVGTVRSNGRLILAGFISRCDSIPVDWEIPMLVGTTRLGRICEGGHFVY